MRIVIVGVTLFLSLGCAPVSSRQPTLPDGLVVLADAQNLKISHPSGYDATIEYDLKAPYPAKRQLDTLERTLAERGWNRTEPRRQHSGLGRPLPFQLGWATILDGDARVLSWTGKWRKAEATVAYDLTYRTKDADPLSEPKAEMLHVFAYRQSAPHGER